MSLPFDLPQSHLPVIVPRPKVRPVQSADGVTTYETYGTRHLKLQADRSLFDIGFMLDLRQFAKLTAAERYTILALQRRLTFSDKLVFPGLSKTGRLVSFEGSDDKLVWATIPSHVVVTSLFTALDIHDQRMALDEPNVLREVIEQAVHGCPGADVEAIIERFRHFKPPHRTDISRALNDLLRLGIVREYIQLDRQHRRAVFNMRMTAATRSPILRGMIKAEDHCRRLHGSEVIFSVDPSTAEPPAKRANSTSTGRRRKPKRADYQSMYHSEHAACVKAEKRVANYEDNGYLTAEQFAELRKLLVDPTVPDQVRETLTLILETVRCDPLTEIPETLNAKDQRHA